MRRPFALGYLLLLAIGTVWMVNKPVRRWEPTRLSGKPASSFVVAVPARPMGLWTWVADYVEGPAWIEVKVSGDQAWLFTPTESCGADGTISTMIDREKALVPQGLVGALVLKLGGSTADLAGEFVRVAGRRALIRVEKEQSGPLFLTMNDEIGGFADNSGELQVEITITQRTDSAPEKTD